MVLNNKMGQAMLVGLMMFVITFIAATMVMPSLFDLRIYSIAFLPLVCC